MIKKFWYSKINYVINLIIGLNENETVYVLLKCVSRFSLVFAFLFSLPFDSLFMDVADCCQCTKQISSLNGQWWMVDISNI